MGPSRVRTVTRDRGSSARRSGSSRRRPEAFGFWLKAAFRTPTTTGTGPWTHEFRSGGWTLPSMSIETAMPEVGGVIATAPARIGRRPCRGSEVPRQVWREN
jgi:hypothetical protein